MPKLRCQTLDCKSEARVRVRGGSRRGERYPGWSGIHCTPHALEVVELQIFQVPLGMTIHIERI